jgi:hypothetical protein
MYNEHAVLQPVHSIQNSNDGATKEPFADFGLLFKSLDSLSEEATLPTELTGFLPFSCMTNCDLSAQWKGLCKGAAAKVHTLP